MVEEYISSNNKSYLTSYLKKLTKRGKYDHVKKALKLLEKLEGNELSILIIIKIVKKLKGYNNLYELIINWKEANYRIFFL